MKRALLMMALFSTPIAASELQQSTALIAEIGLVAQSYDCSSRKTCGKIRSCDEARYYLANCSWGGKLDGDDDGSPCENLCGSNN